MVTMVGFISTEVIEQKAKSLLLKHDLWGIPVNPVAVAEKEGLEVFQARLEGHVSGILRREDGCFRIYVNQGISPRRKRYTVAHELGHFVLHSSSVSAFVDPELNLYRNDTAEHRAGSPERSMEVQANMFAAALLMPAEFVREAVARTRDVDELADLFYVSQAAIGYRVSNLGLD